MTHIVRFKASLSTPLSGPGGCVERPHQVFEDSEQVKEPRVCSADVLSSCQKALPNPQQPACQGNDRIIVKICKNVWAHDRGAGSLGRKPEIIVLTVKRR